MFQYLSFRAAMAIITALLIAIVFGRKIIDRLARLQIGEEIRNLGLEGQMQKKGTPTMGGIIILLAIVVPMLLFCDLTNIYIQLMLVSTIWLGAIGGADDYIKVFRHNKEGLKGRFKIVGQVGLGVIVGTTMWLNADIVVRDGASLPTELRGEVVEQNYFAPEQGKVAETVVTEGVKTTQTTIPFIKDNEFDYKWLAGGNETLGWLVYVLVAIFVITAVSNGANLTDGLDGLSSSVTVPVMVFFTAASIAAGRFDLAILPATLVGGLIAYLFYNWYPAKVFMGDTGSLFLGGAVVGLAFALNMPLVLLFVGLIYIIETMSDILQVGYFKLTHGKRLFKMSPIHHHFEMCGWKEVKIVLVFSAVSAVMCVIAWFGIAQRAW